MIADPPRTRAAALGAALIAALIALYVVAVGTAAGRRLDASGFHRLYESGLEDAADTITLVANRGTLAVAGVALVAAAAYRRSPRTAWVIAGMLVASGLSALVLEDTLAWLDPLGGEHRRALGAGFFPSGHVNAATSLALAAALLARPSWRLKALAAAGALAAVFATAVVASGDHMPSDVAGGFLLAAAWAAIAAPHVWSRPCARLRRKIRGKPLQPG